jgi:hypothetical protein
MASFLARMLEKHRSARGVGRWRAQFEKGFSAKIFSIYVVCGICEKDS